MTAGLEDRVVRNEEPALVWALVWALVTASAAWLITTNIEQPRLLAEEDLTGFSVHVVPWRSPRGLAGTAFGWNPTVRGAKSEDTFIVGGDGAVPLTNTADWPVVSSGRPAILPV